MAWINEQAFFERTLRNELVSLRALRGATASIAVQNGRTKEAEPVLAEIDEAIDATQKVINGASHHP
jgi:hypothetical protein